MVKHAPLWGPRLALVACFSGCFDTRQIPEGAGRGGAGGRPIGEGGESESGGTSGSGNQAGMSESGGDAGSPSASGGASTGGSSINTGGVRQSGGGGGRGGNANTGGATGGGNGSKVAWLAFTDSTAPAALSPNDELGIDGLAYAYADSCATLTWNPVTRCASGNLCNPNNGDNWGVAIGFDFKNTGPGGSPPNIKRIWNPDLVGALGVAWEVTGSAPSLQVWVLNMAPAWNGQCDVMTCEISGPPDGAPTAALNGQLLFSSMRKDDWGGSGVVYSYDPAKVHALQFKLPAIVAGPVPYSFCLKSLGIVR